MISSAASALKDVEGAVTVDPVGEFALKGIRRPLAAYNVLAAMSDNTAPAQPTSTAMSHRHQAARQRRATLLHSTRLVEELFRQAE
jgi:hypothetical protein